MNVASMLTSNNNKHMCFDTSINYKIPLHAAPCDHRSSIWERNVVQQDHFVARKIEQDIQSEVFNQQICSKTINEIFINEDLWNWENSVKSGRIQFLGCYRALAARAAPKTKSKAELAILVFSKTTFSLYCLQPCLSLSLSYLFHNYLRSHHSTFVWPCIDVFWNEKMLLCFSTAGAYLIFVMDATDGVRVNFFGRCKFLQI